MDSRIDKEHRIQQALEAYWADPERNLTKTAQTAGVAKSTLWDRVQGIQSKLHHRPNHARLSDEQEGVLVQHILRLQQQYRPVNYTELRLVANQIAMENCQVPELFRPLGVNWIRKFITRQPQLRSRREQQLEIDHVSASDPNIITAWFVAVGRLLAELGVRPRNMWNADEIGTRHNHHQSEATISNIQQGVPVEYRPLTLPGQLSWNASTRRAG